VFIGGKNKNRHEEKKISLKDGPMAGKTVVMGVMHQSGYVRTEVIKTLGIESLAPMIRNNVKPGSILVTDDHHAYKHLKSEYSHVIVNHFAGEYARGVFSTNSLEGFWALFKRGYVGIYHYMSPKHLSRYFDEFSYRYNNRKLTDGEKFTLNLSNLEGRLTYKMLVHGQGSEEIGQQQETAQTAQD
jgi:transposase-like protein